MPLKYFILSIFSLLSILVSGQTKSDVLQQLISNTGARVTISVVTQTPSFIRFPTDNPLVLTGSSASQLTQNFISQYGQIFGPGNNQEQLHLIESRTDQHGYQHLKYQQSIDGIPVYDGITRWHFDAQRRLTAINGVFLPFVKINTKPEISGQNASEIAINLVDEMFAGYSGRLTSPKQELYIFQKGLVQGVPGATYLSYQVEVVSENLALREFVFVDAHTGKIIDQFTGTHTVIDRKIYQANLNNLIWKEGDSRSGLNQWQKNEVEAAGHMYYLFKNTFGFISYDNQDAPMLTIHENPSIACPNANWNGTTANYCDQTASDDIVAHEWGHAYTDYTSNLIYAWQPGALNESYSDIWGETVDILNGYEDSDESVSLRTGCGSSHRWLMGEDASAFGSALRDLWDPTCKGDPGKVSDPQYHCSSGDGGGVHTNSGVNNHAYALLVDGGTYNGQSITGIGFTKAAHIFWRAQREYLTISSNFKVQADALESACMDLMGIDLEGLSFIETPAGPSGQMITSNDLAELQKVLLAVEMRMDPLCPFVPLLAETALLCPASVSDSAIYYEDFESGLGDWIVSQIPTHIETWESRDWVLNTSMPDNRPGTGIFAPDPVNGDCQEDLQNGILRLESPEIVVPANTADPILLAFDHWISTERIYDGGNLKISINNSEWTLIPAAAFTKNGYNLTLSMNSDNPMGGESAFTGSDGGSPTGSWGTSVVDLSMTGVAPESVFKIRWELGTDGCNGTFGWYLDDISVFSCAACKDSLTFATLRSDEQLLIESGQHISSSDTLDDHSQVVYSAGLTLDFSTGFDVKHGSIMEAKIEGCVNSVFYRIQQGEQIVFKLSDLVKASSALQLPGAVIQNVAIFSAAGEKIEDTLIELELNNDTLIIEKLTAGFYQAILLSGDQKISFWFSVQ